MLSKVKLSENYHRAKRNTYNAVFMVIRSNTEIAITQPRIARLRSNLVQSFVTRQARYAANAQGQRSKVKGKGQA